MADWSDLPRDFIIRPVGVWPGSPTMDRRHSPFKAGIGQTLATLSVELRAVSARNVILRIDIREGDLRIDGRPRMDAKAQGPGVILDFEAYVGNPRAWLPLEYAADHFWNWRDNLRAIALTLNALRAVERYGATKHAEQYRGWQALPPGGTVLNGASAEMTREEALDFLTEHAGVSVRGPGGVEPRDAYRVVARNLHPDMPGGDERLFKRLGAAKVALGL